MKKILSIMFMALLLQMPLVAGATTLQQGSVVVVQPQKLVDADDYKEGDTVKFLVLQPVKVNGEIVIKSGTEVLATVVKKKNNFIFGGPGEIQLDNFHIYTKDNEIIRLRGSVIDKGEGKYWAHIGWFFLFPILFVKGNDGKIQANTNHTLFTLEDINL